MDWPAWTLNVRALEAAGESIPTTSPANSRRKTFRRIEPPALVLLNSFRAAEGSQPSGSRPVPTARSAHERGRLGAARERVRGLAGGPRQVLPERLRVCARVVLDAAQIELSGGSP